MSWLLEVDVESETFVITVLKMRDLPVCLNSDGKDSVQKDVVCLLYARYSILSDLFLSTRRARKWGQKN